MDSSISPPPQTSRSLSASSIGGFDSFIPPIPPSPLTPTAAILSLPTTTKEGVKFVLKAIKQERKKYKKNKQPNPKDHFMVVPPHSWKEGGQKASFIEWGCNALVGFGLRNAGGGVVFLQMQIGKMDKLYDTLEEVFKELRVRSKDISRSPTSVGNNPLRRRSHTYPKDNPPVPAYDPVGDAMDLVTEGISDMKVEGCDGQMTALPPPQHQSTTTTTTATGDKGRIRKGPRPSYSPTPTMNVNMNPMSDYVVRRRRLSSPPPSTSEFLQPPGSGVAPYATDTPMVKRVYWGSQPLSANLDWGGSSTAKQSDIERMNDFLAREDGCGGDEGNRSEVARRSSTGGGEKRGSGMAMLVRSNTLTFDDEVEEGKGGTPGRRGTETTESGGDDMEEDTDEAEEEDDFDGFGGDGFDEEPLQPLGGMGFGGMSGLGGNRASSRRSSSMFVKRESLGDGGMGGLSLLGEGEGQEKEEERRRKTMAKHRRVSMSVNALEIAGEGGKGRESWLGGMAGRISGIGMIRSRISSIGGGLLGKFGMARRSVTAVESKSVPVVRSAMDNALKVGLVRILGFLNESELMTQSCLVNREWWDASVGCHASLMLVSVGCGENVNEKEEEEEYDSELDSDDEGEKEDDMEEEEGGMGSVALSMVKSWKWMGGMYPWGNFLSEGAFKKVYKVWNNAVGGVEAVSVMDLDLIESTGNKQVVGAELAVSVLLSSLVRRNVCPNFILTRRTFTCCYSPPETHWGTEAVKAPKGKKYKGGRRGNTWPKERGREKGRYQYIAMELCRQGDVEEWIKRQPDKMLNEDQVRGIFFQMVYAAEAMKKVYGCKHYDIKNLNFLLQDFEGLEEDVVEMRYGYNGRVYRLRQGRDGGVVAKLADYGTADMKRGEGEDDSVGGRLTLGNFTTLENTPADFLVRGEMAGKGYGHDEWGLGLCLWHLATGDCPYEEIMEDVKCPEGVKDWLTEMWEDEGREEYGVIRSLINAEVYEEGDEKDYTLHDTVYRYAVMFGLDRVTCSDNGGGSWVSGFRDVIVGDDKVREAYEEDRRVYGCDVGVDERVKRGRDRLKGMVGGWETFEGLTNWDKGLRWGFGKVIEGEMMKGMRVEVEGEEEEGVKKFEYMSMER